MEKKLDDKFDPVITKLDGIMKGVEALQQENTVGAQQTRRLPFGLAAGCPRLRPTTARPYPGQPKYRLGARVPMISQKRKEGSIA
jgi:hypothetical protein